VIEDRPAERVEDEPVQVLQKTEDKPVEGTEVETRYYVDHARYQDRREWHLH
jgi:hypothetical protein